MYKRYQCLSLIFAVIAAMGILSSTVAAPLDDKTVLYMSFDPDPEGDTILDESGYDNHGTIIGRVEWIDDGKSGSALEFDGASKIEIPHSDSFNISQEITLEIWFRTEIPQKGRFLIYKMHTGGGTRTYQWGIYLTGDSSTVSMYAVNPKDEVVSSSRSGNYMNGEWHFLAGTCNGSEVVCFIDGETQSVGWVNEMRTGEASVFIGTWNNNCFTGDLDEARICNVALSEEQLKSDYENGYDFLAVDAAGKLSTMWGEIKTQ